MRLHRFYLEQKIEDLKEITITDLNLIHQLLNVFRFKISDHIILFDGSLFEYEAEIVLLSKKKVVLNILNCTRFKLEVPKKVSLYLSLIKKNNFELAIEKCTEIGISEIHPIISERSEKKDLNIERLNKIVKEASEQSGRLSLPKIFEIKSLEKAVSQAIFEKKTCIVFQPKVDTVSVVSQKDIAVFIGPEGGWSETEIELFKNNNFKILSLGENILRAETASLVAVWNLLNT